MYDLIIIGGGPAGAAAAVYAARKRLKSVLIIKEFGGQSVVSSDIQNWIGTPSISGADFAKSLKAHVFAAKGEVLEVKEGMQVERVERSGDHFIVSAGAEKFETRSVLVATGMSRKKLEVAGADTYENKGLTYCASCDGPLFADKDVVVVGGGNAGFETALQLLAYCKSVTLLHNHTNYKADPVTVEGVLNDPRMHGALNAHIKEIKGGQFVTSVVYTDGASGKDIEIPAEGVFAEIGHYPSTNFVKGLVELNEFGSIITDPRTQRAKIEGIWAAGDCTDAPYHQNNIAGGDAVKAVEDLYLWLKGGVKNWWAIQGSNL
ncbi:MAG TPA: hypothetical protein DCZ84_02150 [Candidatus Vogelbacteria bacterium]|nr:MAG: Alkyl hydroperoxide reductase [Parcubacteria group bacterium GW2011_GWF2_52_12]KKW35036.1 MAG: Alkyl hydroperoxide reductase [Parcubacteria group bacterium GW2011_GWB1_53_43]KKW38794.1 MAG: Alkyl hydroperoxide reductase [Parcubacteria group bacterium GW2011_GWA1_54_88]HBB65413.1 hypothetical protein [Candidatus Vogelbacteria bacterium]HBC43953.1 hypothetical protein [Candidatus Vogelbacteria bacterium]